MSDNDMLITQAMLSSYLSSESRNYFSMIEPFVLKCLSNIEGEININVLKTQLNNEFNLDILDNVVEKILQLLCKKNKGSVVRSEKKNGKKIYFLNTRININDFDNKRTKIRNSIDSVLSDLNNYLINDMKLPKITINISEKYLSTFLDSYNYVLIDNTRSISSITIKDKYANTNFYVAQYILREYNQNSENFYQILEIVKGTLAAKSLYYFMYNNHNLQKRLNGTKIYLDTRLLIGALGLNNEEETKSMQEMMKIIIDNGGKLYTFNHYVEELRGIIYKYKIDYESRFSLSLCSFFINNYTNSDIDYYLSKLEDKLHEIGITCDDLPDYDDNIHKQKWHIDYVELRNTLNKYINYRTTNGNSDSLENDAKTIEAISYLRGNIKNFQIENCNCIFATNNSEIVKIVNQLYKGKKFAITDIDLTALLWLSTFGIRSELPKLKLIENVYAACYPSDSVINEFLRKVKSMEKKEELDQEESIFLRTQYCMFESLALETSNDETKVNENIIKNLTQKYKNNTEKEIRKKIEDEINQKDSSLHNKDEQIKQEQIKYKIQKNEMQIIINENKRISQNEEKQKIYIEKSIINKAEKSKNFICNTLKLFVYIFFIVILSLFIKVNITIINKDNLLYSVLTATFSILLSIGTIGGYFKLGLRYIEILSQKVYNHKYAKEMDSYTSYIKGK